MTRDRRGFALVIALVVTALLVALLVEFVTTVTVDTAARQHYTDAQRASLLAGSGVAGATALLRYSLPRQTTTTLRDLWAQPIRVPDESGELVVTVEDENAKLSLNHIAGTNGTFVDEADPTGSYYGTALRLFRGLKLPAGDLCDAVADWVDENDTPKPGGAESPWYLSRTPAYRARNGRLDSLEELALVKGFAGEVLPRIAPFVTVFGESSVAAPININTAPKELLMALDERLTASLADRVIVHRRSTPFEDRADLARVPGLEGIAPGLLGRITVKSSIFRIRAQARVNGTQRTVESVAQFTGGDPVIRYWREY